MTVQIETEDVDYLDLMREKFTRHVPGYQFTPKYKTGRWNGKICMIHEWRSTFPYGILLDYVRVHKRNFPRNKLIITPELKALFKGPKVDINYNLKLMPRPYQKDCIEAALNFSKGIIRSATASGKSLVIAYIILNLLENALAEKCIIIVPSKGLIAQFYQDLIDYGFVPDTLGMVFSKRKQWDRDIIISTWQSLSRNAKKLDQFDCIICDEVHGAKAHVMKNLLSNSTNARYRLGFTGTMHSHDLDNWNTKSYLGPVIREYSSGFLAEQGYVSKCVVNVLNVEYKTEFEGDYHTIRDEVFRNDYRLKMIKHLAKELDHNVLLLVDKVEKEGDFLKDYLKDIGKEVVFLSGRDDIDVREKWRFECMKRDNICLIATYGIFQAGINIPNLKYIIFASPFKAKIRVLQSIGRALRKYANKEEGAQIYDIADQVKFFNKYGIIRIRHYDAEEFEVKESVIFEGDDISIT
jgi:superfamily II DNA or RNA helicase